MIDFSNCRIVSYNHQHLFFGDAFRYAVRKSIGIEGSIYNYQSQSGVGPTFSGISGILYNDQDYQPIILNGTNFGLGRVESINFPEGTDVTRKDYNVQLTIFDSGNLYNTGNGYFSGLDLNNSNSPIYLVENFTEDYSYQYNENQIIDLDHKINLKFISGAAVSGNNSNPIKMAQNLANQLMNSVPGYNLFIYNYESGYYQSGIRFFTENYNQISNECSFSYKQKLSNVNSGYLFTYTESINTDKDGITTLTENGDIQGILDDRYVNANIGYSSAIAGAFTRLQNLYNEFGPANGYSLNSTRLSSSRKDNLFEGKIDYSVSYSNNPNLQTTYTWDYGEEIVKVDECIYNITEKGTIKGLSTTCNHDDVYSNALAGFATVQIGLFNRVDYFYLNAVNLSFPLILIKSSIGKDQFLGIITYEFTYTNDPRQNVVGFKKVEYTVEDQNSVALVSKVNILGVKELVQPQQNSTIWTRTLDLDIVGYRTTPLSNYLTFATTLANSVIPSGTDCFVKNINYSFDPSKNDFKLKNEWENQGTRAFANVTL